MRNRVSAPYRLLSAPGPLALALVAGIVSFTSPCCLPLMPGYVSYVGGVAGGEVGYWFRTC